MTATRRTHHAAGGVRPKNWLFAGPDAGGERGGAIYSLIDPAKLNGRDPEACLRDVIGRIAGDL